MTDYATLAAGILPVHAEIDLSTIPEDRLDGTIEVVQTIDRSTINPSGSIRLKIVRADEQPELIATRHTSSSINDLHLHYDEGLGENLATFSFEGRLVSPGRSYQAIVIDDDGELLRSRAFLTPERTAGKWPESSLRDERFIEAIVQIEKGGGTVTFTGTSSRVLLLRHGATERLSKKAQDALHKGGAVLASTPKVRSTLR